jgi:hypothetical protein
MVATLGDDIKAVMVEVGVGYTIRKETKKILGEYLDYDENTQMTKPFTFQNFLHVNLAYDTAVEAGDVLIFNTDGRKYLVVGILPELFENEILQKSSTLYKTNSTVSLLRLSGETVNYHTKNKWIPINTDFPSLLVDKLYAAQLDETTHTFTAVDVVGLILYAPSFVKPIPLDRIVVSGESPYRGAMSGELRYKVTSIENHAFENISVVYLEEDTRS